MKLKLSTVVTTEFEQAPCIKCGYDGKIELWQDRHYDTATVTCPKCKASDRDSISWNAGYEECVAKIWNPMNDRAAHIQRCQEAIDDLPRQKNNLTFKLKALKKGLFYNDFTK